MSMLRSAALPIIAMLILLAPVGVDARPKAISNGCTAEQIQSSAAGQCINQMQDDILHNRSTFHALYCSSTGKMLCCQYDQQGNTVDHSCDIISTRVNPLSLTPINPGGRPEIALPPGQSPHRPAGQGVEGVTDLGTGGQSTTSGGISVFNTTQVSETTVGEQGVRDVCGKQLQSNGGVIGCTKKCGNYTCDYSCGGPQGPGCRVFVFSHSFTQAQRDTLATALNVQPIQLKATKLQVKTACGKIAGIDIGPVVIAGKPSDNYGCFNDAKVTVVICRDGVCYAFLHQNTGRRTLNAVLGVMSSGPDDSAGQNGFSNGSAVVTSPPPPDIIY